MPCKKRKLFFTLLTVCFISAAASAASTTLPSQNGDQNQKMKINPSAALTENGQTVEKSPLFSIESDTYRFPATVDGMQIRHDFIIKNKGTDVLKILKVKTS
jgi:uncharacterized cupredoxin-like copper-binding protein